MNQEIDKDLLRINNWEEIQSRLVEYFKNQFSGSVQRHHIFDALYLLLADKKELQWRGSLLDIDYTYDEAVRLLENFDFDILFNSLETSGDILPESLIIQYKVRVKVNGLIWIIHRYDADPFPSNPHAHQVDNNIKLDLSNGMCYKHRNIVHKLSKKELLQIRNEAIKVYKGELPPLKV